MAPAATKLYHVYNVDEQERVTYYSLEAITFSREDADNYTTKHGVSCIGKSVVDTDITGMERIYVVVGETYRLIALDVNLFLGEKLRRFVMMPMQPLPAMMMRHSYQTEKNMLVYTR